MIGVLDFQSHQEAYSLKGIESLIDVVAQKHILHSLHLFLVRVTKIFKDVEQILKPPIN